MPVEPGYEDPRAAALLEVVCETLRDLHGAGAPMAPVALDSALERDLGLDSLARVELLLRVERAFGLTLPENTLQVARTPRDLLEALRSPRAAPIAVLPAHRIAAVPSTPAQAPAEAATLLDVLNWHALRHGDRTHVVLLSGAKEETLTYGQLKAGALRVAGGLQLRGLVRGQAVAIMLPTGFDFFYTYFGILLAGGIPVPIYPPARLTQIEEHVVRHAGILTDAEAATLVTVPEAMAVARLLQAHVPALHRLLTAAELSQTHAKVAPVTAAPADAAFIQYTSGSTGNPKGVVLTHANLLANIRAMARVLQVTSNDVFVSWLPLYHDMGLIGAWLGSLYTGCLLVLMSPLAFLSRPERWLWAIDRFRATISGAPNFAYELCAKRIADAQLGGLDLSSWRLAFNGAEAVSADTIAHFTARFAPYGLRPEAITPVYGLAESSVGLLFPPLGRGPLIDRVQRDALTRRGKAVPAATDDPGALRFVACGRPLPHHEVRIVDDTGLEVADRVEGRLEFKGPSATAGYYRNAQGTKRVFHGDWLDSGDRAYTATGEVFVTGRVKDIVIRGGRHIYPEEIEDAVGALPGVRKGCVAVFGSPDPNSGTERLVVLAETRETARSAREGLGDAISRTTLRILGEPPDAVILAPAHTVLKTSSGKIRRAATRELYESAAIGTRSPGVAIQVGRLVLHAIAPQARRFMSTAGEVAYAAYASLVLVVVATATWLVTAAIRDAPRAWRIGGMAARTFFRLVGVPLTVHGLENLPRATPHVLVANHSSYLDGVALIAALPAYYRFVAKRELREQLVAGVYLSRLGAEFVERFDAQQSVADAGRLAALAAGGASLAFFPEGTFTRAPGLQPFHLGAFVAAARAGVPTVPVAIRGTRTLLRGGQWFPRRGAIAVTIGAPVAPAEAPSDAFAAAVTLRDVARVQILRGCGEPDAA